MRKGAIIAALALVCLLAFNGTVFMAFAAAPTIVINPVQGFLGESFNFDITATSESTVSEVKVKDPDGNIWVLKGLTPDGWKIAKIWLNDADDKIRLIWPEVSFSIFSVLNDPNSNVEITANGSPITDLAWWNSAAKPPHTQVVGTYALVLAGTGCQYFYAGSFLLVPEGPVGTLSFLLICITSLVMYKRVRPKLKL